MSLKLVTELRLHQESQEVEGALLRCGKQLSEELDGLTGFAIVAWSRDGEVRSAYQIGSGPIGMGLVPTLACDALNRHVALDMAPSESFSNGS